MTIDDLVIEPKFRDLIPKLTDAEYKQLEENILADGRVKEPIVVWGNTIVDGHHRYYILKDHPEIPYEIEQKEFANEYAAMAWACANQLGRRNLNEWHRDYLIGKRMENEQMSRGRSDSSSKDKSGRYTKKSTLDTFRKTNDTASKIAQEEHVGRAVVYKNEDLSKGIDIAESVAPGIRDRILSGEINSPKNVIRKIPKVAPDKQRKAVIALSKGNIDAAKEILGVQKAPAISIAGIHDANEIIEYTADDLINEVRTNFEQFMSNIESTLNDHADVLHQPDCKDSIIAELNRIFEKEIERVKEI